MRNWPANLVTHLQREVLNVASCWKVTRQDGVILRFTDFDVDILLDLDVSSPTVQEFERYLARSGFTRSTIVDKADLSVNDLDVQGLIDSLLVTDVDLRAGKYDHALVEIFLVNWQDPLESEIGLLRKGRLGQTTIKDTGYEVELRGLLQGLQVEVGDVYAPLCRVDLFSPECGLVAANYEMDGSVLSVTDRRQFIANTLQLIERLPVPQPIQQTIDEALNGTPPAPDPNLTDRFNVGVNIDSDDFADGTLTRTSTTGDGTEDRPFTLSSQSDLNTTLRNNPTAHFRMTADINMTGFGDWDPITSFAGVLDGAGFEIQNLDLVDIGRTETVKPWGFISVLTQQGVIKRLGMDNAQAGLNAASTVHMGTVVGRCHGTIEDCYSVNGSVDADSTSGNCGGFMGVLLAQSGRPGGGLADVSRRGTVKRCFAANAVNGTLTANDGGFMGSANSNRTIQENLFFDSDVAGTTQAGTNSLATDLTTALIQDETNLTGFDHVNVWIENGTSAYSTLLDPGRGGADPFIRYEAIDLTSLATYSSGNISWTADEPGLAVIAVSIATDGETFTSVTNGAALPGFSASQSLVGVNLTVRVDFQTSDSNVPTLEDLDIFVEGENAVFADDAGPPVLSPSDDDWFVGGLVTWNTGNNLGLSMEVKTWTFSTKELVLYLQMPFDVQEGDEFTITPGCKKRDLTDCKDKFDNLVNNRSEPFVPGADKLYQTPDSQTGTGNND